MESTAMASPRIKSVSQWILAIGTLMGLALAISGTQRIHRMLASLSWPAAPGVVETSERQRGLMRQGSLSYKYHIVYRYTVKGSEYRGHRLTFTGRSQAVGKGPDLARQYPEGTPVQVHYHPKNPGLAVLDNTWSWSVLKILIPGLLLAVTASIGLWRRWPLQTDYLFRERDPDAPMTWIQVGLGTAGILTCLGIAWIWWELIKMYAGR